MFIQIKEMNYDQRLSRFIEDIFGILDNNHISSLVNLERHCGLEFTPSPPLSIVITKRSGQGSIKCPKRDRIYKFLCYEQDERTLPLMLYLFEKESYSKLAVFYDRCIPTFSVTDTTDSKGRKMYLKEIPSNELSIVRRSLLELDSFLQGFTDRLNKDKMVDSDNKGYIDN